MDAIVVRLECSTGPETNDAKSIRVATARFSDLLVL